MRHCWTIKDDVRDSIFAGLLSILSNIQFVTYRTARSVRPLWTSYISNGRGAWRFGHPMVGLMVPWPQALSKQWAVAWELRASWPASFLENPKFFQVQWYLYIYIIQYFIDIIEQGWDYLPNKEYVLQSGFRCWYKACNTVYIIMKLSTSTYYFG